ncbi:unnamed protein product [Candidula unifasciata]|uniref:BHLH domain-containing protein n=1 Tax=Candidula unifasciata TaxID=100452 RepID=A0A8S4A365_9EUPU|nr:unnamed protein product [Candidula unifasciata]
MKVAAPKRQRASTVLAVRTKSSCQIMKTRIDFRGEKLPVSEEMKECFRQLLDMVPDVPRNEDGNIDGTVLIQNVIDYILDLELQLDGPVASSSEYCSQWRSAFPTDCSTREPLSEKSLENTASIQVPFRRVSLSADDSVFKRTDCDIRRASQ